MLPFMLPLIATFASGIATTLPALLALCRSMKLYPAHRGYVNNVSPPIYKQVATDILHLDQSDSSSTSFPFNKSYVAAICHDFGIVLLATTRGCVCVAGIKISGQVGEYGPSIFGVACSLDAKSH
ncbi:hypothetical protein V8C43DRAFT_284588 [Trichoderma afarasin]